MLPFARFLAPTSPISASNPSLENSRKYDGRNMVYFDEQTSKLIDANNILKMWSSYTIQSWFLGMKKSPGKRAKTWNCMPIKMTGLVSPLLCQNRLRLLYSKYNNLGIENCFKWFALIPFASRFPFPGLPLSHQTFFQTRKIRRHVDNKSKDNHILLLVKNFWIILKTVNIISNNWSAFNVFQTILLTLWPNDAIWWQ